MLLIEIYLLSSSSSSDLSTIRMMSIEGTYEYKIIT